MQAGVLRERRTVRASQPRNGFDEEPHRHALRSNLPFGSRLPLLPDVESKPFQPKRRSKNPLGAQPGRVGSSLGNPKRQRGRIQLPSSTAGSSVNVIRLSTDAGNGGEALWSAAAGVANRRNLPDKRQWPSHRTTEKSSHLKSPTEKWPSHSPPTS